jgi:cytosine/uracil/thiamine/allantoin permease
MGRAADLLKRLEVKPTDDEYETIETSRWGNRDVYPIAHDKRTYGVYAYVSYWGNSTCPLRPSQTYTSARHMRHLSLLVDDR